MKKTHLTQLLVVLVLLLSVVLIGSAAAQPTEGQLVRGDVNGDGSINMKDVLLLRKYLADMDVTIADHVCTVASNEESSATQASETTPSASESAATQATQATQASETQASASESAATQATQATETSATTPIYTLPSATESSATQATESSATTATTAPSDSVKIQMNITEQMTKYSDEQTRDEYFYVAKGEEITLLLTYDDVYHADEKITNGDADTWFTLQANGVSITPEITSESNTAIYASYSLGTATSDITITGNITRFADSSKLEDFKAILITVNGVTGEGSTVRTTPMVLDEDYPAVPDMVTIAFNDPETCSQYGLLWHTYKDLASPTIQYLEGSVTDTALFAANATSITSNITETTDDALVTLDYDPVNNWDIGSGTTANVTQYTYRGVLPTSLKSSTTYSYRVGDATTGTWSEIYTFTTRPETVGDNFSFLFLNDTQFTEDTSVGTTVFKNLLNAAVSTCQGDFGSLPQLVLHGGDLISENTHTYNYGNVYGANGDFFGRYPMFATLGNHDASKKYFFNNWNVTNTTDEGYYSFNYGTMHVTVLDNSSEGLKCLTDEQIEFLKSDLQANSSAEWKIVMLHRPVYSALTYNQNGYKEGQEYWEYGKPSLRYRMTNVCNDYDVDFVFQAHCHQYMRSYPITDYTKTDLADSAAIEAWDDSNDSAYVEIDSNPTMSLENGTNYYVNPEGTIYGTFSTAGTDPDEVISGSTSHNTEYTENKWVAYAANGEQYSFTAVNINGGYLTIDHCYLDGSTVKHYENTRGYGIKKAS